MGTHDSSVPSESRDDRFLRLAMAISDGVPIDWSVEDTTDDPETQGRLNNAKVVEAIARSCGMLDNATPAGDLTADLSRPQARGSRDDIPTRWGQFRILEILGEGSFGVVCRARDTQLDIDVALKLLVKHRTSQNTTLFLDEARQLAKVKHPNVVAVRGADVHNGIPGLWMDLLVGQNLEDSLQTRGILGPREAVAVGSDLCAALAAIHRVGLAHGDVKAANVMRLDDDGRVVLMDFGTVREAIQEDGSLSGPAGTPVYMAPEIVLRREPPSREADIYAVGVTLYRLLTKTYPIDGQTYSDIEAKHRDRQRVDLRDRRPDLPVGLIRAVDRALEPEPRQRFKSPGKMERALAKTAEPPPWWANAWRRGRWPLAAGLAMLVLYLLLRPPAPPAPPPPLQPEPAPVRADVMLFKMHGTMPRPIVEGDVVHPGDELLMELSGKEDLHAYVLNAAEKEPTQINLLFPTDLDIKNPLVTGGLHRLPGRLPDGQAYWRFSSPGGQETIVVIVSRGPLVDLENRFPHFNRMRFTDEISHLNLDPQRDEDEEPRGIEEVTVGAEIAFDSLLTLARELEIAHRDDVWVWRLNVECRSTEAGTVEKPSPGAHASENGP